jgi:formylglycine-generating enzyme required for sulfatase activity
MKLILVPRGKSWLGGGSGQVGTKQADIPYDFYLGAYEVTQQEWEKVVGSNPSKFQSVPGVGAEDRQRFPVENVSWEEAQAFIKRLNEMESVAGWVYRLPTQVEWEYACRGGPLTDPADSGFDYYLDKPTNQLHPNQANCRHGEALNRTAKVGSYQPNRLGLYDMHGNVWECCSDTVKAADGTSWGVYRGGGWDDDPGSCRTAIRFNNPPSDRNSDLGLRVARVPVNEPQP